MKTKTTRRGSDETVGRIVRHRDGLEEKLQRVTAEIHEAERRACLPVLEGRAPSVVPELPQLAERRDELLREIRLTRLALDIARGKA